MTRQAVPIEKRFWQYVQKGTDKDCWIWTGSKCGRNGTYGQISFNGRRVVAHRVSYILAHGDIPNSLDVCHTCDNSLCVNPAHLWLGTHAENIHDRSVKGRSRAGASHKHPLAKLNWEMVGQIRTLYRQGGITQRQLARRFGVSAPNISLVITGKAWNPNRETVIGGGPQA